ncbi:MAG TPA: nuclear transport factor 2 family protein [Pseudonocardia sp.]|nr:nuclear transport factor 2 family protein [Pseudonocardia sp.]
MSPIPNADPDVPTVIATYLAAKLSSDTDRILDCFTDDALVHDEGRDHRGRAAISAWLGDLASKYTLTYTVLGVHRWTSADATGATADASADASAASTAAALRVEVAGNFPGSPVVLHQHFSLAGDRIAALTICP